MDDADKPGVCNRPAFESHFNLIAALIIEYFSRFAAYPNVRARRKRRGVMNKEDLRIKILDHMSKYRAVQFQGLSSSIIQEVSQKADHPFDENKAKSLIDETIYDLITERFITFGSEDGNAEARYPFIVLTEQGRRLVSENEPHFYDPQRYISFLEKFVNVTDEITTQYAYEAVRCFRGNLLFAAAVMIGAAAERAILSLLEAIVNWEKDPKLKKKAENLLNRGKLPSIFVFLRETIEKAIRDYDMPYNVYEGAINHLISFQEMVRVQRNEAVHPDAGKVSRDSVYLSLQTFPTAFSIIMRVRDWYLRP